MERGEVGGGDVGEQRGGRARGGRHVTESRRGGYVRRAVSRTAPASGRLSRGRRPRSSWRENRKTPVPAKFLFRPD